MFAFKCRWIACFEFGSVFCSTDGLFLRVAFGDLIRQSFGHPVACVEPDLMLRDAASDRLATVRSSMEPATGADSDLNAAVRFSRLSGPGGSGIFPRSERGIR